MGGGAAAPPEQGSFQRILASLPLSGRTGLAIAALATFVSLASIIWFGSKPPLQVLYSNLPETEAGRVVEHLTKMNVPYELAANGTAIKVPGDKVYNIRLELATQGIPKGEGVGFEIFDQTSLTGMTDFMQRMNLQRALQGELSRTIEHIAAVRKARVHLVMPKRSLFVSEDTPPSASVVMELSKPLNAAQIQGVVHLISSAVEGMDEHNVTLLDQKGNLIAGGKKPNDDGSVRPDEGMAMQRQVEKSLEERVQTMLDRLLGANRSITRVTADLDLSRVERREEKFDPDGQVARSEQTVVESSKGQFGPSGVPGVQPNDANAETAAGAAGSAQSRDVERETINYEISKTVNRVLLPVGTIKRLSVAVLVDGNYPVDKEKGEKSYKARSEEEMQQLQAIIERAVGLDKRRGDTIQVTNAPFEPLDTPSLEPSPWEQRDLYVEIAKYAGVGLVILLLVLMVLRPLVKRLLTPEKKLDKTGGLPTTVADLEAQLLAEGVGSVPSEQPARLKIPDRTLQLSQQMIADHADEAREILRFWMTESGM